MPKEINDIAIYPIIAFPRLRRAVERKDRSDVVWGIGEALILLFPSRWIVGVVIQNLIHQLDGHLVLIFAEDMVEKTDVMLNCFINTVYLARMGKKAG